MQNNMQAKNAQNIEELLHNKLLYNHDPGQEIELQDILEFPLTLSPYPYPYLSLKEQ